MSARLAGRTALVTGGGSGIGRVIAHRFAAEGAPVVVADIVAEKAEEVAREIEGAGGSAIATHTDVSVARNVAAMRASAEKAFGHVDILVNNAAIDGGERPPRHRRGHLGSRPRRLSSRASFSAPRSCCPG